MSPRARPAADPRFEPLRRALAGRRGPERWAALDQLIAAPGFDAWLQGEHPRLAAAAAMDRRGFLRLAGASLALAGVTGCGGPEPEAIVPWQRAPEARGDDTPRFYASSLGDDGDALGVLVETHDGRPTKIEGNPDHPASLGATDVFAQAAVLDVWDPDRSRTTLSNGEIAPFEALLAAFAERMPRWDARNGVGLRILSAPIGSPTLSAEIDALLERWPGARVHHFASWHHDAAFTASRAVFGRALQPLPQLDRARVILALDADPLGRGLGRTRHARAFADGRRSDAASDMSRIYVAEPSPTLTGANADHRLALGHAEVPDLLLHVAARVGVDGGRTQPEAGWARWADAVAADLQSVGPDALLLVGETQPAWVQALGLTIGARLGSHGRTLAWIEPPVRGSDGIEASFAELVADMSNGQVDSLVMLGVNPVYASAPDLPFRAALARVSLSVHLGEWVDESARAARWHVPAAHALERWGDATAFDGTLSLMQPAMTPLYGGRSALALIAALRGAPDASDLQRVRAHWAERLDDAGRTAALQRGVIADSAAVPVAVRSDAQAWKQLRAAAPEPPPDGLTVLLRPDPTIGDGRHANNGWLQELPRPHTTLTWENALWLAPALAERLAVRNGDEVEVSIGRDRLRAAAWRVPGQAETQLTAFLGGGRRAAGRVGDGIGYDVTPLRRHGAGFALGGAALRVTGTRRHLAQTQPEQRMHGREPVRSTTLAAFLADPGSVRRPQRDGPFDSLYPERPRGRYAWGMTIDLNACIGCGACTIACQAENNIPVVGAEQVRLGREMHWMRVDRYRPEDPAPLDDAVALHQPLPCMHCEHAPCELVCPVAATVHDADGLNVQVYNRCVGTRFCSNNCPYKVRRFNFLQYADADEHAAAQRNPAVTVRDRGVMEKCTYCIQRIRVAEIDAHGENRDIADGEVRSACQSVCPTDAIRFGNLADADSAVSRSKAHPLHYVLLAEQNTRPRTSYLARLRNANPVLEGGRPDDREPDA